MEVSIFREFNSFSKENNKNVARGLLKFFSLFMFGYFAAIVAEFV